MASTVDDLNDKLEDHFSEMRTPSQAEPDAPATPLNDTISAADAQALKEEGNTAYKAGDYDTAVAKYSDAITSAHATDESRAIYLANRAAANLKRRAFADVVADTTRSLQLKPGYVKALTRRKDARQNLEDWRGACDDAKALKMPPNEIFRLQQLADRKEVKDNKEALKSLKGFGDSVLSSFGMSMDDFAFEKDPKTGSYSVNMKK